MTTLEKLIQDETNPHELKYLTRLYDRLYNPDLAEREDM